MKMIEKLIKDIKINQLELNEEVIRFKTLFKVWKWKQKAYGVAHYVGHMDKYRKIARNVMELELFKR